MKILVCSLTYPLPNGVTSSVNESVNGLVAAGHDVRIVSPDYGLKKTRPEYSPVDSSELGQLFVTFFGKKERMFGILAAQEIKEIVTQFQPDIFWLHTVSWAKNAFEREMLKTSAGRLLTYHTMIDVYGRMYAGAVGEKRMISRSVETCNAMDAVITPSKYMAGRLKEFGVTVPVSVVPSGIEPINIAFSKRELASRFHFPERNALLLYVGRVVREKNISELFRMMAALIKIRSEVTLLLVGPGDIDEMKQEVKTLGLTNYVVFAKQLPLEETRKCYGAADVFVFASQTETQGLVVGEAMIAGVPVVALHSPIQPEVYPREVAVVVDDPTEFAPAVDALLADEKRLADLAKAGHDFVATHFTKAGMITAQIKIMEDIVANKKSQPRTYSKTVISELARS